LLANLKEMKNLIERLQATIDHNQAVNLQNHAEIINALTIKSQIDNKNKDELK
jgi:hypothetical protein